MARPHLAPFTMEAFRLVYFANGNDVDTVIVDGEIVLSGGVPLRVSSAAVVAEANREAQALIDRMGLHDMIGQPEGFFGASRYPTARGD